MPSTLEIETLLPSWIESAPRLETLFLSDVGLLVRMNWTSLISSLARAPRLKRVRMTWSSYPKPSALFGDMKNSILTMFEKLQEAGIEVTSAASVNL